MCPAGFFFFLFYLQVCMNGTCQPHSILNYDCNVQKKCSGHGVSDSSAAGQVVLCCSVLKRLFPGVETWPNLEVLILQNHHAAVWEKLRLLSVLRAKSNGMRERGVFAHLDEQKTGSREFSIHSGICRCAITRRTATATQAGAHPTAG